MSWRMLSVTLVSCLGLAACGGGSGAVGTSTGNPIYFPSGLAIASPFDRTTSEDGTAALNLRQKDQAGRFISRYEDATSRIDRLLQGSDPSDCLFDPVTFLTLPRDAQCYGPRIAYEAHPDATGPADPGYNGILPPGDVGLWTEADPETGHACAAAELNARLEFLRHRSVAALSGLASLICTARSNGLAIPQNATLDLVNETNRLGIPDVTFEEATITHSEATGRDEWSYSLRLSLTRNGRFHEISVTLTHTPGPTGESYEGQLSTQVNEQIDPPGNCPSSEQTYNGSLVYDRPAADDLQVDLRAGHFCGHDSDGTTDGIVDPAKKYDPETNPTGWANNFSIFRADFNPSSTEGNYLYAWQAGARDGYTRTLNAVSSQGASDESLEGDAFYGFGDDIEVTDGGITGFFCNWAGPKGSFNRGTDFRSLAQHQSMTLNQTTGKFDATESQITYAPVSSCEYDGASDFRYDSDGDGTIDTDPTEARSHDLISLEDRDGDGLSDAIAVTGFVLP